jgi:LacI family transcriptional regulator
MNGDPRVGQTYRDRVLAAVEELDYRPNRLAKGLRTQRSAAIGVVVADIENPHFSEMVRAVEDVAFSRGHPLLVCNTDENPEKQRVYLNTMLDERVLGVIISPAEPNSAEASELLDAGIPVVAFDREISDPRADVVIADNTRAARVATELLTAAGHREIAFVAGRPDVETGAERLDGYELAMRNAGLIPHVLAGAFRTEEARARVAECLNSSPRPTALVIANNLMTLGALHAIRDAGLLMPTDIALVGIDDPQWAAFVQPPLTTMAQPVRRMAVDAVELLFERVSGARTEPRRVLHRFELRRRASCGTAPVPTGAEQAGSLAGTE